MRIRLRRSTLCRKDWIDRDDSARVCRRCLLTWIAKKIDSSFPEPYPISSLAIAKVIGLKIPALAAPTGGYDGGWGLTELALDVIDQWYHGSETRALELLKQAGVTVTIIEDEDGCLD